MTNADNKPVQTYTPINADTDTSFLEHQKQKEIYTANPDTNPAYTNDELARQMTAAGIDPDGIHDFNYKGGYTQDRNLALANGGSGDPVPFYADGEWYMYDGKPRDVKEGDSGADEALLSEGEYAYIQHCKKMYAEAKTQEGKNYWHNEAEKTRARAGYSGGTDGSDYITLGYLGVNKDKYNSSPGKAPSGGSGASSDAGTSSELKGLLDTWQQAAMQQSDGQIDYAVAKAVAELQRALADAQPQFKEQAESVDRDARQAMDNSALHAELRGDKGGIGQEQYNAIQNTQAQNHLAVQQAQTKLATDTARQIADLRAQGEFEKADAALAITQTYLTKLISLEQWAAEYNLSVAQFEASLQQWEAEYDLSMQKLQTSQNQWQAEFDYDKQLNSQNQLASMGTALLNAGVMPGAEHLAAMGITVEQASEALWRQQLTAAQGNKGKNEHFDIALEEARKKGNPISALKYLDSMVDKGYLSDEERSEIYYLYLGYEDIIGKELPLSVNPGLVAK